MNVYYQNWIEVVARIDRLQFQLFLIVFVAYWLYRWYYGPRRFVWIATGFSLVMLVSLSEPLWRF